MDSTLTCAAPEALAVLLPAAAPALAVWAPAAGLPRTAIAVALVGAQETSAPTQVTAPVGAEHRAAYAYAGTAALAPAGKAAHAGTAAMSFALPSAVRGRNDVQGPPPRGTPV